MRIRDLFLSLSAAALLTSCGVPEPDYEAYKTASPYESGPYRPRSAPLPATEIATPDAALAAAPIVPAPAPAPAPALAQPVHATPATGTSTFNMLYETSRSGGTARVNGEQVEVRRLGKASSGEVSYIVMYMGKNGAPTAFPPEQQAGVAASLVRGMTLCQVNTPAMASSNDVLSMIGGVPDARYTVKAVCP